MERRTKRRASRRALVVGAGIAPLLAEPGGVKVFETAVVHAPVYPEVVSDPVSVAADPVTGMTFIAY